MGLPDLRSQFSPFEGYVQDIRYSMANGAKPEDIPGYLNTLLDMEADIDYFAVPAAAPNEKYVGLLFRSSPDLEGQDIAPLYEQVENKALTMAKVLGHTGFEQIVAYSAAEPLAIVTRGPEGRPLYGHQPEDLISLPDKTYARLFETFMTMEEERLAIQGGYYASIMLPEVTSGEPPDFVITKYRKGGDKTYQDHVLALASDMAAGRAVKHSVPREAVRYYRAVEEYLDRSISSKIVQDWQRRGYEIPAAVFDA